MKVCEFNGCEKPHDANGLCGGHRQQRRNGKALSPLTGHSLTAGMTTRERFQFYVNIKSDGCWNWTGTRDRYGYGQLGINGQMVKAHRLSFSWANPDIDITGVEVDHICHTPSCVNPEHLRTATRKQNMENRSGKSNRNSVSGIRGVCWDQRTGSWRGQVTHHGKRIHVGRFASIQEAQDAVTEKRNQLFTHNLGDRAKVSP